MNSTIKHTNESRELSLFAVNDYSTYTAAIQPAIKSLKKKVSAGTFDADKATKQFYYVATAAAQNYAREFGGVYYELFSTNDRRIVASYLLDYFMDEVTEA